MLAILLCLALAGSNALECGVIVSNTTTDDKDKENKDINQVITTCLIPTIPTVEVKVDNTTKEFNDYDEPEEPPSYGPRRGILRPKRELDDDATTLRPTTTSTTTTTRRTTTTQRIQLDPNDPKRCVVQCILQHYTMLNEKLFPDIKKVSAVLMKSAENRELRDFLQDSVDDCFFKMTEIAEPDACAFAAQLVTCLADKGRQNCADWPVGELPFPHRF